MPHLVGCPNRTSRIPGRWRDIDPLKRRSRSNLPVSDTVHRASPSKTQNFLMSAVIKLVQNMEEGFLVRCLEGSSNILVPGGHRFFFLSRRTKELDQIIREDLPDHGSPTVPGHGNPLGMMEKVLEVEFKPAFGFYADQPTQSIQIIRFPVSRQAHHLVLVTIVEKSQVLGQRQIEEPERMGKRHAIENLDPISFAAPDHRADKISEPVHRDHGAGLERRHQKRRGEMGPVMLHVMDLCRDCPRRQCKAVFQFLSHVMHLSSVLQTVPDSSEAGALREGIQRLFQYIGARIAIDGKMFNRSDVQARLLQAGTHSLGRKSSPVFDATKPFLFRRCHKLPIYDEAS